MEILQTTLPRVHSPDVQLNKNGVLAQLYTSEKVENEIFANTEREFNSDSGENEDLSYVEETENENQQKNRKLMNS